MTHHGTTRKVVEYLVKGWGNENIMVIDLAKNHSPDLTNYETIVIGGSIHIGQIQPGIKRFCERYKGQLLQKRLGLFLCFMNKELGHQEFENAFPEELRNHAIANGLFGGELLIEKMNFVEKFMVRMVSKETKSKSQLDYAAIDGFMNRMK